MRLRACCLVFSLCLAAQGAPSGGQTVAGGCAAANARYAPEHAGAGMALPEAELVLAEREVPSAQTGLDLVLLAPGLTYPLPFEMIQSQGFGRIAAYPAENGPLADVTDGFPLTFFAATPEGRLRALETVPQASDPAPDALFVAGLPSALWYATNGAPTAHADQPVMLPVALWYRSACG